MNAILKTLNLAHVVIVYDNQFEQKQRRFPKLRKSEFINAYHTSSNFYATLAISNIGLDPLDRVVGNVRGFSNITGTPGALTQTLFSPFTEYNSPYGNVIHYGKATRLAATYTVFDDGQEVTSVSASVDYKPR